MPDRNKEQLAIETERWVDLYGDDLYRFAYLRTGNRQTAEDLVQETFLSALKALDSFQGKSSVRTWLTSILNRKIIDYYRRKRDHYSIDALKDDPDLPDFDPARSGPVKWRNGYEPQEWSLEFENEQENEHLRKVILRCIELLPEKLATVFKMRELENLPSAEICKILEISASNIWVILHRARTLLRRCLEKNWFGKH